MPSSISTGTRATRSWCSPTWIRPRLPSGPSTLVTDCRLTQRRPRCRLNNAQMFRLPGQYVRSVIYSLMLLLTMGVAPACVLDADSDDDTLAVSIELNA